MRLLKQFEPFLPHSFERYIEPFVGGGALFFHLWSTGRLPGAVCLFDSNEELINVYRVVRDQVDEMIELLAVHQANHSPDYYYYIRGLDRDAGRQPGPAERAARTIYLNRTCYNGLYRVNRHGQFNVPLGRHASLRILQEPVLRAASVALRGVDIEQREFRTIAELARPGDFYYFDPPYDPSTRTANFTGYTAGAFREQDQQALAQVFAQLAAQGCHCLLSNSHTPLICQLYAAFPIRIVHARRAINSDAGSRGPVEEVLVLSAENERICKSANEQVLPRQ